MSFEHGLTGFRDQQHTSYSAQSSPNLSLRRASSQAGEEGGEGWSYSATPEIVGYNPPWADAVDERGNVFFVQGASATPLKVQDAYGTARRLRNGLSPSSTLVRTVRTERRPSDDATHTTVAGSGKEKRKWSLKIPKMLKVSSGQRKSHHDGPDTSEHRSAKSSAADKPVIALTPSFGNSSRPKSLADSSSAQMFDVKLSLPAGCDTATFSALGITPGRRKQATSNASPIVAAAVRKKVASDAYLSGPQDIVVRAVIADGPAARSGKIQAGDEIVEINGIHINQQTAFAVLATMSAKRQFLLKVRRSAQPAHTSSGQQLLSLMNAHRTPYGAQRANSLGPCSPTILVKTKNVHHVVMYLVLEEGASKAADKDDEEVVYRFPGEKSENGLVEQLLSLRGLFLTLSDIMRTITGTMTNSSTIVVKDKAVHIGYLQLGKNLLVLALPAEKSPLFYLDCVMEDIERLLAFTFGSVHGAFTKKRHKERVDQLFALVFERLLSRDREGYHHITDSVHGVHRLPIPLELQTKLSASLSELEADDHSLLDEVLYLRRPYLIQGSCLFYKGYLVESHLPDDDTQDLALYCRYYCLLQLSSRQKLGQLVIWHEVFLSRRSPYSQGQDGGVYTEQIGRTFLLTVGYGHALVCVLLEAGATTAKVSGHPGPVPYYIDEVQDLLISLDSRGLFQACESRILMAPVPAVVTADQALASSSVVNAALAKFAHQHGIKPIRDEGTDSDSGSARANSPSLSRAIFAQKAALPPGPASAGFRKSLRIGTSVNKQVAPMASLAHSLTAGEGNMLFHYINIDAMSGVMVCPLVQHVRGAISPSSPMAVVPLHADLVSSFHRACIAVREVLCRRCILEEPENVFSQQNSLRGVYEHGILMQLNPSADKLTGRSLPDKQKAHVSMNYWVIGRLFREPVQKEFYVCIQESMSQNVVEMAFKLCYGASL